MKTKILTTAIISLSSILCFSQETIIPLGEQYDTRFLSTPMEPVGISLPSESVIPDWVNENPKVGVKDISPQIQALTERIRANTNQELRSSGTRKQENEQGYFNTFMNGGEDGDKINLAYKVPIESTHVQLSDGSYKPKYKTYFHGTDNKKRIIEENQKLQDKRLEKINDVAFDSSYLTILSVISIIILSFFVFMIWFKFFKN